MKIIYAKHPSHSVNYHNEDIKLRNGLLASIREAIRCMNHERNRNKFIPSTMNELHLYKTPAPKIWPVDCVHTTSMIDFLDMLMTLCFRPNHMLPKRSIGPSASTFFRLDCGQKRWLNHSWRVDSRRGDFETHSRAVLIPIFERTNQCVRKVSCFLPKYAIHLSMMHFILKNLPPTFESSFVSLARGTACHRTTQWKIGASFGDLIVELDRMTNEARDFWTTRSGIVHRNGIFVGFSD
jgi:hypothetical protein